MLRPPARAFANRLSKCFPAAVRRIRISPRTAEQFKKIKMRRRFPCGTVRAAVIHAIKRAVRTETLHQFSHIFRFRFLTEKILPQPIANQSKIPPLIRREFRRLAVQRKETNLQRTQIVVNCTGLVVQPKPEISALNPCRKQTPHTQNFLRPARTGNRRSNGKRFPVSSFQEDFQFRSMKIIPRFGKGIYVEFYSDIQLAFRRIFQIEFRRCTICPCRIRSTRRNGDLQICFPLMFNEFCILAVLPLQRSGKTWQNGAKQQKTNFVHFSLQRLRVVNPCGVDFVDLLCLPRIMRLHMHIGMQEISAPIMTQGNRAVFPGFRRHIPFEIKGIRRN